MQYNNHSLISGNIPDAMSRPNNIKFIKSGGMTATISNLMQINNTNIYIIDWKSELEVTDNEILLP